MSDHIFPEGFAWGVATASYQIEGAPDVDGKGKSIWDIFSHTPGKITDGNTGDQACESYHKYMEDIEALKQLGVSHYRFSLSWSRLLPNGDVSQVNPAGVNYYHKILDALKENEIQPMVTLYHWDLPQVLQDKGGWTEATIVDTFVDYAKFCFNEYGDKVKLWITFNEPLIFTWYGHASGEDAPGIRKPTTKPFLVAHNVLKAHANVYRLYDKEFRKTQQGGQIGISLNIEWTEPLDATNESHCRVAEKLRQCKMGWFSNPIFGNGDYPESLKKQVRKKCKELGQEQSSLPEFTQEEIQLNKGSADFVGLNHYTTRLCSPAVESLDPHVEGGFFDVKEDVDPSWKRGASSWLYVVPWGLRNLIRWFSQTYNKPVIYITENGISDNTGRLDDEFRVDYYKAYIKEVWKAINEDGCDVRGYIAWTLMDNFEWAAGFTERFGLYYVDFDSVDKKRVPKKSAKFYAELIKNNGLVETEKMEL